MINKFILFILLIYGLLPLSNRAQSVLPFIENYTKENYRGDNQIWSYAQGTDNALYFANNHYLLRYNGVRWEKYTLPNKTIIRSVYAKDDKIYTGSFNEFGYWKRENGQMNYYSLVVGKKFFKGYSQNEEIWKIFEHENKIYFQTFNELYILDKDKIDKIKFPTQISYCFIIQHKFYAASITEGIYELKSGHFIKMEKWSTLKNKIIHHIDYFNGSYYFFTRNSGIFIGNDQGITVWKNPLNEYLKDDIIITAKILNNNKLAIGTASNGIYLINLKSDEYLNINRTNSLQNNSVLCIGTDRENDIWLGLDNGITHLEINSPYRFYKDLKGILGSVYSIEKFGNNLLLGSNHGLYLYDNKELKFVKNSQGQVWNISNCNNNLIVGHNDGTFLYDNNGNFKFISSTNGGWQVKKDKFSNRYIQSNYTGISFINFINGKYSEKRLEINPMPIKDFVQISENEIIMSHSLEGLFKVTYDNNLKVSQLINLTAEFESDFSIKIFTFKNENLYFIDNNWYFYDKLEEKLKIHNTFNKNFFGISDISLINDSVFSIIQNDIIYIVKHEGNIFNRIAINQKYYSGKIINGESKIFNFNQHYYFNLDDGFLIIDSISEIYTNQGVVIEAFIERKLINANDIIPNNSKIEIEFIPEYFGNKKGIFSYSINDGPILPIIDNKLDINNLSRGSYKISAYFHDGLQFKKLKDFSFKVRSPWYLHFWMFIIYLLIIFAISFLYYRWNKIRFLEKLKLKEEELKHQNKIIKIEMDSENQMKLKEFEKQLLKEQVQTKANELASKSLYLAKQTDLLEKIQNILDKETNVQTIKSKISNAIKVTKLTNNEWKSFEDNLLKSNEAFVEILTSKHKTLTPKDIKLCIYLKMNLSSKEIAPLMNISFRGVELHRYRLRKKLDIQPDKNLNMFINNLK